MLFSIRSLLLIILLLPVSFLRAQIPAGSWRVHLPFFNNNSVTTVGTKIYCGSASGIFALEVEDGSVERLSRINGFSDVEVKIIKHHADLKTTLVVYENGNIDVVDEVTHQIYNIPDIFLKNIIGGKRINGFCFYEKYAYLACNFGLVVLDLEQKRLVDSWQNLGPGGAQLEFFGVDILPSQNTILAAAADGIYSASLSAPNLNDFNFWSKIITSTYSHQCRTYKGKYYAVVDSALQVYDGISWTPYAPSAGQAITALQLSAYGTNSSELLVIAPSGIWVEQGNGNPDFKAHTFRYDATYDFRGYLSMVDGNYGLTIDNKVKGDLDYVIPNGPVSKTFGRMLYENSRLWVAAGSVNDRWDPLMYNGNKFYRFEQGSWYNFRESEHPLIAGMSDFIEVKKNPFGPQVYLSSFGSGIIEVVNNEVIKKYDETNSSLQRLSVADPNYKPLLSGGMDFDNYGNLWVSNFGVNKPLSVKTRNGWFSYSIGTLLGGNELGWVTCDDYNNKWVLSLRDKGILVYNDNGTPANGNDDQYKLITKEAGQGALPSNTVLCASRDQNGEMWIGTSQGLAIISNPGQIFRNDNKDYDARQIIIKVGTNYEVFLGKEQINCIKVDPANRKWIGTPNGVWLVSDDGYKVIRNFTVNNSPLLSNNVMEIGIDESTGEVFFGTEKGIISFTADASEGAAGFDNVEIFPNPVSPDYSGSVTIRGLMDNSVVKIADIAGNLVYETKANGGYISWDGRNLSGRKVNSGVYIVFASNNKRDDLKSYAGKIVFIH